MTKERMTKDEALKLAQKAMGLIGADLVCEAAHHEKKDRHQIGEPCPIQARWHQAFAAIKEALAQHDSGQAKPEQEPVAWMCKRNDGHFDVLTDKTCKKCFPVYTTPPQRTWVGLTDEDKQTAFDATQEGGGFWEFADAIEAKLKQKNGYAEEKNLETRAGAT